MTTAPEVIDALFAAALKTDRNLRTRDELAAWLEDVESRYPVARCHDWRNHLPEAVWDLWDDLSLEAKLVAFIPAATAAHAEEWD